MITYEHAPSDASARIRRALSSRMPVTQGQIEGFDYREAALALRGPVIEIAGPTDQGFPIINDQLPSQALVSNISEQGWMPPNSLDFITDARDLPFDDGSVGMVLASCIPFLEYELIILPDPVCDVYLDKAHEEYANYGGPGSDVRLNQRLQTIEEIGRVLSPKGLLVWQGGTYGDIQAAQLNRMEPMRWSASQSQTLGGEVDYYYECVFQKQ